MAAEPIESLFGTSAAAVVAQFQYIKTSQTFVVAQKGTLDIFAVAGHASGAVAHSNGYVSGAGAGETAVKTLPVEKGDTFTITIGAGGAQVTRTTSGITNGNNGSDTTIVGPNVNMTIKGGLAALASSSLPVAGGLGGRGGTGGDEHYQGGDGGSVLAAATTQLNAAGSGAVNVKRYTAAQATAQLRGGNNNSSSASASATGGAGVGGRGADISGASLYASPAGGGYGGPGTDNTSSSGSGGPNALGVNTQASPTQLVYALATYGLDWFGGGADSGIANAGPGGGGAGRRDGTTSIPGIFAGAPATIRTDGASSAVTGVPGQNGPGGSAAGNPTGGNPVNSGAGASGMAIMIVRV